MRRDLGLRASVAAGTIAAASLLGGTVTAAAPAAAATCGPAVPVRGDFGGDGKPDAIVGMPDYAKGAGAVDVRYTSIASRVLTGGDVGGSDEPGSRFGSALAIGDLDGDGCTDAVIGAPHEDTTAGPGGYTGRVYIVFGSSTGLQPSSAIAIDHPASAGDNPDEFGASVALQRLDLDGVRTDLFVGAPGSSVDGHPGAGAVWRYSITPGGPKRVTVGAGSSRTQDSPGVPGVSETGDRFGEKVTSDDLGVVASAPMEDVGDAVDAGAIWQLQETAKGVWSKAIGFNQSSPGVAGTAESGDHFGASLGSYAGEVLVGVPDEDDGRVADAGMVHLFESAVTVDLVPVAAFSQRTKGVPGVNEAGDRFGAAVATGYFDFCDDGSWAAIGVPGEDVGSRTDAGTIVVLSSFAGLQKCPAQVIRQGYALRGAPEAGDQLGSVLGSLRGGAIDDATASSRLLIGVPLEDVGAQPDAGMVLSTRTAAGDDGHFTVDGTTRSALTFSGGYRKAERYGQVLPSSSE